MRLSNDSVEPIREANINFVALKTAILLLIILCLVPTASAKDYTLEGATANITISPSGVVHVEESISYVFEGN